jgi:hypothetical protein
VGPGFESPVAYHFYWPGRAGNPALSFFGQNRKSSALVGKTGQITDSGSRREDVGGKANYFDIVPDRVVVTVVSPEFASIESR